jgi:amino acid transporter
MPPPHLVGRMSSRDNGEGFFLPILGVLGALMCVMSADGASLGGEPMPVGWVLGAVCFAALAGAFALARN